MASSAFITLATGALSCIYLSRARARQTDRQQASAVHAPGEVRRSAFILSSPAPVAVSFCKPLSSRAGKAFYFHPFAGAERRAHQPWRARLCSSWPSLAHAPASGLRRLLAVPRGRRSPAAHGKSRWMRTLIQRPPRPTPRPVTGVPACGEGPRQKHRTPALRVSRFLLCRYQAAARAQGRLLRRGVLPQLEDSAAAHEARNVGAAHLGRGVRCRCCHKSRPRLSARRYPGGPRAADGPSTSLWRPDRLRPQEIRPSLLRAQAPPPPATTTRSGTSLAMCSLAVALVAAALVPASHPCRRAQSTRSSSLGNAAQPHSLLALRRPPPTAGVSSPRTREQPCLASPWPRADAGAPQGLQPAPRQRRMSRQLQGATQPPRPAPPPAPPPALRAAGIFLLGSRHLAPWCCRDRCCAPSPHP